MEVNGQTLLKLVEEQSKTTEAVANLTKIMDEFKKDIGDRFDKLHCAKNEDDIGCLMRWMAIEKKRKEVKITQRNWGLEKFTVFIMIMAIIISSAMSLLGAYVFK